MFVQAFYKNDLYENPLVEIWYLFYWSLAKKLKPISCLPSELVDYVDLKRRKGFCYIFI